MNETISADERLALLGDYLERSESEVTKKILAYLWDGEPRSSRSIVDALCIGAQGGPHWRRLRDELYRLRTHGLLDATLDRLDGRGHLSSDWTYRITDGGRALLVEVQESRRRRDERLAG